MNFHRIVAYEYFIIFETITVATPVLPVRFKIGDTVMLRSGGPHGTIRGMTGDGHCQVMRWNASRGFYEYDSQHADCWKLVP